MTDYIFQTDDDRYVDPRQEAIRLAGELGTKSEAYVQLIGILAIAQEISNLTEAVEDLKLQIGGR